MLEARVEEPRQPEVLEPRPSFFRAKDRKLHIMRALMPGPRNATQAARIAATFAPAPADPALAAADAASAHGAATTSAKRRLGGLVCDTKRK